MPLTQQEASQLKSDIGALVDALVEGAPPAPTASVSVSPSSIQSGQSATVSWSSTDADAVTLDGAAVALSGSQTVTPAEGSYTYTLVAGGPGGSVTATATLTVTAAPPPDPNETVISGYYEFEELHVHEGKTLRLLPGAELVRLDVPPSDPAHADGGIVVHGKIVAVRTASDPPIIIRSQNPGGYRGHLMIHGTAELDGIEVRDFGRTKLAPLNATTNPIARYAVHWHLAGENGRLSRIENCLIHDTITPSQWRFGIAIHGTNGVLCRNNTIRNKAGSGIYLEDGTEVDNVIEGNVIEEIVKSGLRPDGRGMTDLGHDGAGVWLRSPKNRVRNNIVRRCAFGYLYFVMQAPTVAQQSPVLEFLGNRAETCNRGLEYWWIGGFYGDAATGQSIFDAFTATNCEWGIYGYQGGDILIRGANLQGCRFGYDGADYLQRRLAMQTCTITGGEVGVIPSSRTHEPMLLDGCTLQNTTDVQMRTLFHNNDGRVCPARKVILRNTPLNGTTKVHMRYVAGGQANYVQRDELIVEGAYRVLYNEQRSDFIVPQSSADGRVVGCPVAGLTNAEAWAQHGVAIAGEVAPAGATTQAGITGLVVA